MLMKFLMITYLVDHRAGINIPFVFINIEVSESEAFFPVLLLERSKQNPCFHLIIFVTWFCIKYLNQFQSSIIVWPEHHNMMTSLHSDKDRWNCVYAGRNLYSLEGLW